MILIFWNHKFESYEGNIKPNPEVRSQVIYRSTWLDLLITVIPLAKFACVCSPGIRLKKLEGKAKSGKFQKKIY